MQLLAPPMRYKTLRSLVIAYNSTPDTDIIQKLFYLQKINYVLNKTALNNDLYEWINHSGNDSWVSHLTAFSINPYASFFLKGIQFAKALCPYIKEEPKSINPDLNQYQLMQQRDKLLNEFSFEEAHVEYLRVNYQLNELSIKDHRMRDQIELQTKVLAAAESKFEFIKKRQPKDRTNTPSYHTQELGNQVNNYNTVFAMGGWDDLFVFRVEDRPELSWEQDLHSFEVSKYFIQDFAVFMGRFRGEESPLEFRPVVLSQFANQNNLAKVARELKGVNKKYIAPRTKYYFDQLADFCTKLMDSGTYHPDIKLTNFLVHNDRVLVSDRKTLITSKTPKANIVRSSPLYAPEEYLDCLEVDASDNLNYAAKASITEMNMPQFMAFQLGMALKEFLILTQVDSLPDDFRDSDRDAASYFESPPQQIINLSDLAQELTRPDPEKRMTVEQFKKLIVFINEGSYNFPRRIEAQLPASKIGLATQIAQIQSLITNKHLKGEALLDYANVIFKEISESEPKEIRLVRMAEQLAVHCFTNYSQKYFAQCSNSIEEIYLNKDWEQAPWYRKALHVLSFGYIRVARVAEIDIATIKIPQDLKGKDFQTHFPLLEFLPSREYLRLGKIEGPRFEKFIITHINDIRTPEPEQSESNTDSNQDSESRTAPLQSPETVIIADIPKNPAKDPIEDTGTVVIKADQPAVTDTVVIRPVKDKDPLEQTGTVVIHEDKPADTDTVVIRPVKDKDPLEQTGTVVIHEDKPADTDTVVIRPVKDKDPLEQTGTVVIHEDKPADTDTVVINPDAVAVAKNDKGEPSKPVGANPLKKWGIFAPPSDKDGKKFTVDSVRTALRNGNGSERDLLKNAGRQQRKRITEINWEPVTPPAPKTP